MQPVARDGGGGHVAARPTLKRSLGLWQVVLYGLGVTIGAGIYVLVGPVALKAGLGAPLAFLLAALVMTPSALSFAELTGRWPTSSGEAAFVREGFGSPLAGLIVGLLVIVVGIVSAAAISVGAAGYVRVFLPLPEWASILLVVLAMGLLAAWGIVESVTTAAIMTLIEVCGLLLIVLAGILGIEGGGGRLAGLLLEVPDAAGLPGLAAAGLLAFFAFIGFEGIVNIAEEVKEPRRVLPLAIGLTLAVSTLLYALVAGIAVLAMPVAELAASQAPLALVYERLTGLSPLGFAAIAVLATLNGIVIQLITASRVVYGLAAQGSLPAGLGAVSPLTATPLLATGLVVGAALLLALVAPLGGLAEATSRVTLLIFALVNLALLRLKLLGRPAPAQAFTVPAVVPGLGALASLAFLLADLWT